MYVSFEDIRTFDVVGRPRPGRAAAGEASEAADEVLGTLHDLYLDTRDWRVSWLVLESGGLLAPNRVLIGSERRVAFDTDARRLVTDLTRYDVETAPGAAELRTVSEQRADERAPRFGPRSASSPLMEGQDGGETLPDEGAVPPSEEERYLGSARELIGWTVAGRDEEVGPVRDLLIDTDSPEIAWLAIDTGHWLAGREVVIRPSWTTDISWRERCLRVDLTREQVRGAPPLDELGGLDRAYASSLARFYRFPTL